MSPVSRGRKPKKTEKTTPDKRQRPSGSHTLTDSADSRLKRETTRYRQPSAWFGTATETVLGSVDHQLTPASGPRELEQATAELLGSQLHHTLHHEPGGFWFNWWVSELIDSAVQHGREGLRSGSDGWQGPWLLLHGLTSIETSELRDQAREALRRVKQSARPEQRSWLWRLPRITATGDVWRMRDVYGTRFAVLASYSYPGSVDPYVYLFGIDASGFVLLEMAEAYDDLEQAAAAWRTWVGDAAEHAEPHAADNTEKLSVLWHSDITDSTMIGHESRNVLDNWFRATRRLSDLEEALRKQRMPLPQPRSLYRDIDIAPMATEFTAWYTNQHGQAPHADAVDDLACEWLEGSLPETWYLVSPARLRHLLALISDWPRDEITNEVITLLPEWTRWLGERAELAAPFMGRALEASRERPEVAASHS